MALKIQKSFGKIFWFIFKNFQPKFLDFGQKTANFTRFWKNKKKIKEKKKEKKSAKTENLGRLWL